MAGPLLSSRFVRRKTLSRPRSVTAGLDDIAVSIGSRHALYTFEASMLTPLFTWPTTPRTRGSSQKRWATALPSAASARSSASVRTTDAPRIPPAALRSSTATWTPCFCSMPRADAPPDSGPATAMTTVCPDSWAAAGPAARATASAMRTGRMRIASMEPPCSTASCVLTPSIQLMMVTLTQGDIKVKCRPAESDPQPIRVRRRSGHAAHAGGRRHPKHAGRRERGTSTSDTDRSVSTSPTPRAGGGARRPSTTFPITRS